MSFWRIGDWTWQTFCYMPITDSISQLIDGESIVFGCLCLCHSVIALSGRFTWNWSKVAVNRVLLNAARAAWSPVFFTHHRPHHVSGVRGPENGSLFFRRIAYVILLWIMSDTTKAVAFGDRYNQSLHPTITQSLVADPPTYGFCSPCDWLLLISRPLPV